MDKSYDLRAGSYIFGFIGGGAAGFALGYTLAASITGRTTEWKILGPVLGAGIAFIAVGVAFEINANKKAREAIAVYNNAIKQKQTSSVDLGFSPTGIGIRLNF
jgi:hypothetical protein